MQTIASIVGLSLALCCTGANAYAAVKPDPALAIVKRELGGPYDNLAKTYGAKTKVAITTIDLNRDGKPDYIVHFQDDKKCAAAPCPLRVLLSNSYSASYDLAVSRLAKTVSVKKTPSGQAEDLLIDGVESSFNAKSYW